MELKIIFEKLYPSYSKKLWKFILDESINLFIQMLLICSLKFTADDRLEFVKKIGEDRESMRSLFGNLLPMKDVDQSMQKLLQLEGALTDAPDQIPDHLVKLRIALGKQYNDNCTVGFNSPRNVSSGCEVIWINRAN